MNRMEEDYPISYDDEHMTLHYVMSTVDGGFVWVSENSGFLSSAGRTDGIEKVTHLSDLAIAYGPWGQLLAAQVGHEFADAVRRGNIEISDQESVKRSLKSISFSPDSA